MKKRLIPVRLIVLTSILALLPSLASAVQLHYQ